MARLSLVAVASLLSTGSQAYVPIQWAKFPDKGLIMMPKVVAGHGFRSFALPQKLTVGKPADTMMLYFTAKADNTISVGGLCIEASGAKSGDAVVYSKCNGLPRQQWNWIPNGDGQSMLQLKDTALCIDVNGEEGSSKQAAVELELRPCENKASQAWTGAAPMPVPAEVASFAAVKWPKADTLDVRHVMAAWIALVGVGALSLSVWFWQRHLKTRALGGGIPSIARVDGGVALTAPMLIYARNAGISARSPLVGRPSPMKRRAVVCMNSASISYDDLKAGGAIMTEAIIAALEDDDDFQAASAKQLENLLARDSLDAEKLAMGIKLAIDKGVLDAEVAVEPVQKVNVTGKTPEENAKQIVLALGDAPSKGCVLTIQGLSGLGKGTTVTSLENMLPKAQTWSNGNIFRSVTLLAVSYAVREKFTEEERTKYKDIIAEFQGEGPLKDEFDARIKELLTPEQVLTKENLADFMGMLSFGKFQGDEFDTKIEGLGLTLFVSEVKNTRLKTVSTFVPIVAEVLQGEVIGFIKTALDKMTADGCNILLEGREQTLNYIRTPHRFELVIDDNNVIGMRQAALIIGSNAKERGIMDDAAVMVALYDELANLPK